jgi:hypothetical protein
MHIQLGNVAEWAAGVGTVAAFGVTSVALRRDSKARAREQADRQWDQANEVKLNVNASGVKTDQGTFLTTVRVEVRNDGRRAVKDVEVKVFTSDQESERATLSHPLIGSNGKRHVFDFVVPPNQWLQDDHAVTVSFTDVAGERWSKDQSGDPIQERTRR